MTTTVQPGDVTIAELAADLTELLLQPRRIHLRHRAPRRRSDHQLRRDVACGKAKPVEMLLRLEVADLQDGAPLAAVLRFHEAAIVVLRELAATLEATTAAPALLTASLRETRAQASLDEAQQVLLAEPDSVRAMDRVLAASEQYDREQEAMVRTVRERRARASVRRAVAGVA